MVDDGIFFISMKTMRDIAALPVRRALLYLSLKAYFIAPKSHMSHMMGRPCIHRVDDIWNNIFSGVRTVHA